MKTSIPKQEEIQRKWYIVDASNAPLGRLASEIAVKLRGKDKPIFTPHLDCGDFVIVINSDKAVLTGNKEAGKMYYTHSGYMGNLRTSSAKDLRAKNSRKIVELAVYGMLPKNRLRDVFMKKMKIYKDDIHPHEAQKPEKLEV